MLVSKNLLLIMIWLDGILVTSQSFVMPIGSTQNVAIELIKT